MSNSVTANETIKYWYGLFTELRSKRTKNRETALRILLQVNPALLLESVEYDSIEDLLWKLEQVSKSNTEGSSDELPKTDECCPICGSSFMFGNKYASCCNVTCNYIVYGN